jgi:hypothetical protein
MLNKTFAERFAAEWIAAWNSHDLDRVLSHYADDFEMSSPYIAELAGEPSGKLKGKEAFTLIGPALSSLSRNCILSSFQLWWARVASPFITKVIAVWPPRYSFLIPPGKWSRLLRTMPADFLTYRPHELSNDQGSIRHTAGGAL